MKQWEEKTTKLDFFSVLFVQYNKEIHFSFKNSEKQQTQALNHFPKTLRSVLHKTTIDPLYFWDIYDVNLWEKNFERKTAYLWRPNIFI